MTILGWLQYGALTIALFPMAFWYFHWLNWFHEIPDVRGPKVLGPFDPLEIYRDVLARPMPRDVMNAVFILVFGPFAFAVMIALVLFITGCWLHKYYWKYIADCPLWDFTKKD